MNKQRVFEKVYKTDIVINDKNLKEFGLKHLLLF